MLTLAKIKQWLNPLKSVDPRITAKEYGMTQEEYDSRPKVLTRLVPKACSNIDCCKCRRL